MTAYLFGDPIVAVLVGVILACAIGLASSIVFTWASSRSAFWNMGFAVLLVAAGTVGLLLTVAFLLRQVSY